MVINSEHRWWSVPIKPPVDILYHLNEKLVQKLPFGSLVDFLFPWRSTYLTTIYHFANEGALGKRKGMDPVVWGETLNEYEWGK